MFHVPAGNGVPIAPGGSATCGTPIALSTTEIRSTRRGTSGPAIGPGICPSTGTKVKSGARLPLPAAVDVEDADAQRLEAVGRAAVAEHRVGRPVAEVAGDVDARGQPDVRARPAAAVGAAAQPVGQERRGEVGDQRGQHDGHAEGADADHPAERRERRRRVGERAGRRVRGCRAPGPQRAHPLPPHQGEPGEGGRARRTRRPGRRRSWSPRRGRPTAAGCRPAPGCGRSRRSRRPPRPSGR